MSSETIQGISDREAVVANLEFKTRHFKRKNKQIIWKYHKADSLGYQSFLREKFSEWVKKGNSVNRIWDAFKEIIFEAVEKFVPKKCIQNNPDPEYYNEKIRRLKRKVRAAHRKVNKGESARDSYSQLVKVLNKEKTVAHDRYLLDILKSNDNSNFYKYLRRRKDNKDRIKSIKNNEGLLLTNDLEKANEFNKWFGSVFHAKKQILGEVSLAPDNGPKIKLDYNMIYKKVKCLRWHKSKGPDNIASGALKLGAEAIIPYIKHLFTVSLANGSIPTEWKTATVIPIKDGNRTDIANYRLVILMSVVCKLVEKLLADYIRNYLEGISWIFRNGHSCEQQLLGLCEDIAETWVNNQEMEGIVIDLSKAFDVVPHDLLLAKVNALGIDSLVGLWIEDFLRERKQRLRIGDSLSDEIDVTSGVPQ